jgi:hypothetical protein
MAQQNIHKPRKHLDGYYRRKILSWYSLHKRLCKALVLWSGIPIGIIIVVGFIPFSNNMLREKVESVLENSSFSGCSIKRVSLTPWLGFSIDGLKLTKTDGFTRWEANVPHIRLSYRIIPLIFHYVTIKKFAHEDPRMRLVLTPPHAPNPPQVMAFSVEDVKNIFTDSPLSVAVKNISVVKGTVSIVRNGKSVIDGQGVNVVIHVRHKKAFALSGSASARRLTLGGLWDIENIRLDLRVNGLTTILENCKGDFYGGRLSASGNADLEQNTLGEFRAELSNVNLAALYRGARINQGKCEGRLDAKIAFRKSVLAEDFLAGSGRLRMSRVEVSDLPIQNTLIVFVAVPQIKSIAFSSITTDLEIRNGKIYTPSVRGDGYPLEIRADGWVGFDGYFSEKMNGVFAADLARNFHSVIANSLDDAGDGKKSFTCTIFGKFKNPQIDIDGKIQQRAFGNVLNEIRRFFTK